MSDPNNNEEKITSKQVQFKDKETGTIRIKYIDTIKCKECGEEFTTEWVSNGYLGEDEEYHRGLRAKLRDHKEKVHQIFEEGRTCSKCQKYFSEDESWYHNEKHGKVCENCLNELEKQGELWDNFFEYNFSHGGGSGGSICDKCKKGMLHRQNHKLRDEKLEWFTILDLTTIRHNCQVECSECKGEKFQFTQEYLNFLKKHKDRSLICLACKEKQLEKENKTEALKDIRKLLGKSNDNDRERERERAKSKWQELFTLNNW